MGQYSEIVPPEPMVGGHGGGVLSSLFGVVELEDGRVALYTPNEIRFVDGEMEKYCFFGDVPLEEGGIRLGNGVVRFNPPLEGGGDEWKEK